MARSMSGFAEIHPQPTTPLQSLQHVLAVFDDAPDDRRIMTATSNIYGDGITTGLTMGDLRWIAAHLTAAD